LQLKKSVALISLAIALGAADLVAAQARAPAIGGSAADRQVVPGGAATGGGGVPDYPVRAPGDPAAVARGRRIFVVNCGFCHGSDARGGESGPNLVRSQLVMDDKNGELIAAVVQDGRPEKGMPQFKLAATDVADVVAFIHSIPAGAKVGPTGTVNPLVGDANAGKAYFNGPGKCHTCHSVTGDLAGIGGKYTDVRALQDLILTGGGKGWLGVPAGPPVKRVAVTLPSGDTVEGKLDRIDDFIVSLTDASGHYRSFRRDGDVPKVVVKDPFQPHLDMLRTVHDTDIHNLTAYLVTMK
jgi:cytochrome c oxidase cbb3-type subunit III